MTEVRISIKTTIQEDGSYLIEFPKSIVLQSHDTMHIEVIADIDRDGGVTRAEANIVVQSSLDFGGG